MAPKFRFQEGEKVLCFHGPLLYEAKCYKVQLKDKQAKYLIHYSGWNKNWDEWVAESRVLKYNKANLQKQKEIELAHLRSNKSKLLKLKKESSEKHAAASSAATTSQEKTVKPKSSSSQQNDTNTIDSQKKKPRLEPFVESEEDYLSRLEIRVRIPEELKPWLVDDWDLITRQKKLVQLPARLSVDQILAEYVKQKTSVKGISASRETAIIEVTSGIKEYFNAMLFSQLLYKFERLQYNNLVASYPGVPASQLYGSIHLVRLFVKLGGMLSYTPLDEKSIQILLNHLHDFLKYMARNSQLFSSSDYIPAADVTSKRK